MALTAGPTSPLVDEGGVTFSLDDRSRRLAKVRLLQEIGLSGRLDLRRAQGRWGVRVAAPDVDRMEYLFEIEDRRGHRATITDPANPKRATGAFGDKSVALLPGYREPKWLTVPAGEALEAPLEIEVPELGSAVTGTIWASARLAPGEVAPLLVVHDGPEYAALGDFTHYLAASVATGALPPVRAVLLAPGDRDDWYSANPAYAKGLCGRILPVLDELAPATVRVGVGASLGALALLHAHWFFADSFDGLLLQSGSFFTPELDPQEKEFPGFPAVTRFVAEVHAAGMEAADTAGTRSIPTVLTCGVPEENLANNRLMAATLRNLGYSAALHEVRDAHNYTAWRDSLDPHLTGLVTSLVTEHAA